MSSSEQMQIAFKIARGGPSIFDPVSQRERASITSLLEAAGVPYSHPDRGGLAFDSASELLEILVPTGVLTLQHIKPIVIEWIKGRTGQKVRISKGKLEIEAGSVEEVERLWQLLSSDEKKP